ncbi:Low molecular weight phosphotyrosine protein phosphatase [Coniothyrium glycines]
MSDPPPPTPVSVLFVCLGNICRSTMAEAVFRSLTSTPPHPHIASIDSCGTGAYHVGCAPDARTLATLRTHGITAYRHAARKFNPRVDFDKFAYVFAMDGENLADLQMLRDREVKRRGGGEEGVGRVMLFGEFGGERRGKGKDKGKGEEVEDPYYGGEEGFEVVYGQCVRFGKAFLGALESGEEG